jgi:pSer/pThr/pTyr-binding forkhead associated (FHA) protein
MIKCPECDVENTTDSNYCRRCGTHLVDLEGRHLGSQAAQGGLDGAADESPDAGSGGDGTVLQIRSPADREGELFVVEGDIVTIGRSPKSDLFLDDVTVSRRHAHILVTPDAYNIVDEESLNGTYVNRRRIDEHQLFDGDEIQIGKFRLAFLEQDRFE